MASCSCAAGRCTSSEASNTFFRFCAFSRLAIFAAVVVLPEPCSPTSITMTGGGTLKSMPLTLVPASPPPSASTRWSWTILTTICAGLTERRTSCPSAFSRTAATKSRTTGSATSASSSAMRISRNAVPTSASVSAPWRRSRSKTSPRRSLRLSNIPIPNAHPRQQKRQCARLADWRPGSSRRVCRSLPRKRSCNVVARHPSVNCTTLLLLHVLLHEPAGSLSGYEPIGAVRGTKTTRHREEQVMATADDIISACKQARKVAANVDHCNMFVIDVAARCGVALHGNADQILDQITGPGWRQLGNGGAAAAAAVAGGDLVIGGMTSEALGGAHGHVVIVVEGPLNRDKY